MLSTINFSSTAGRGPGSNVHVNFVVGDRTHTSPEAESIVSVYQPGLSTIVGRHVFYNNSAYYGNDPSTGASDDGAIATDKAALGVGQAATFANYTSYHRGINGIMIDRPAATGRSRPTTSSSGSATTTASAAGALPRRRFRSSCGPVPA